ncbi:MAG: HAMP domain-containing histidine kinase [Thermoanaerobaculum sp.]|nr:HAMP domain-containing histidine kinase [Thermoanaerobaculum sp.]
MRARGPGPKGSIFRYPRRGRRELAGRTTKILSALHLAAELLERALTPEHAGWIALVTLTAGQGFGFNRAFLLRRSNGQLEGWLGVGPRSPEEAGRLWHELRSRGDNPLARLRTLQPEVIAQERARLSDLLHALATPVEETCGRWTRGFLARRDVQDPCVKHWVATLQSPVLLVVPLVRQGVFWGVLLADNFVTHAPITAPLLEGAQALCHNLQVALERTELWASFQAEQEARRRAENALLLVETARALAHDIKNPLTAAAGLLQHLLQHPPPTAEAWERWGRRIAEGLSRVEQQVNQLVRELASRGQGMELTSVDAGELVQRLVASWQPLAESRQVALHFAPSPYPVRVWADPRYLERCVENLLSNAIKAVGLGGEVRVTVVEEEDRVRISVADNGHPLPQTLRANPFGGGAGQGGGPGEGLASVRRLTEAMGGHVEYDESEPGWVRFSVTLGRSP